MILKVFQKFRSLRMLLYKAISSVPFPRAISDIGDSSSSKLSPKSRSKAEYLPQRPWFRNYLLVNTLYVFGNGNQRDIVTRKKRRFFSPLVALVLVPLCVLSPYESVIEVRSLSGLAASSEMVTSNWKSFSQAKTLAKIRA